MPCRHLPCCHWLDEMMLRQFQVLCLCVTCVKQVPHGFHTKKWHKFEVWKEHSWPKPLIIHESQKQLIPIKSCCWTRKDPNLWSPEMAKIARKMHVILCDESGSNDHFHVTNAWWKSSNCVSWHRTCCHTECFCIFGNCCTKEPHFVCPVWARIMWPLWLAH